MGSGEDISEKAFELIGCIVPRLLSKQSGYRKDDLIRTLRRLGSETDDWRVRACCERAVQMLSRGLH